jgi:hypothetical protein
VGRSLREALRAQQILKDKYNIGTDVWSVTSYSELRRDAMDCQHWNDLHPGQLRVAVTWKKPWTMSLVRLFQQVTTYVWLPIRFANGFRANTLSWVPTDLAAAKLDQNCVATSQSTANARHTQHCVDSPAWARLTPQSFQTS